MDSIEHIGWRARSVVLLLEMLAGAPGCSEAAILDACDVVVHRRYLSEREFACLGGGAGCRGTIRFDERELLYCPSDDCYGADAYACEDNEVTARNEYEVAGQRRATRFRAEVIDPAVLRLTVTHLEIVDGVQRSRHSAQESLYLLDDLVEE